MKERYGDIIKIFLKEDYDVLIHGCNCHCVMGAGLAARISRKFPGAYQADLTTKRGDKTKLGTYTLAIVGYNKYIVNAYTQINYGRGIKQVNYNAIDDVFKRIQQNFTGKKLIYPTIGAGLGGGKWSIIKSIIKANLKDEDHTVVYYRK